MAVKKKTVQQKDTSSVTKPVLLAKYFIERLKAIQSDREKEKIQRYFKTGTGQYSEGDQFMGVRMGQLFALAKQFSGMPIIELEKLLDSAIHEVRAGAVSIMDKESRTGKVSAERLENF